MSEPYLRCPTSWITTTLEPNEKDGLITRVETGSTPSTTCEEFWDGDIPWLTPKEISDEKTLFISKTERTLTKVGLSSISSKLYVPGTVMLTKRAPVGYVAVNAVPMATNQGFLNFTCGPLLRPLFLAYWFKANKPYLDLVANGSTYPELYISDLFEFQISVPPLSVQDQIIEVINAINVVSVLGLVLEQGAKSPKLVQSFQSQSNRLNLFNQMILPVILSGMLNLSNVSSRLFKD